MPLLLLTVVGGIGTAAGPLFTGVLLGGFPIAIAIWPFLENLNRLLPGTMGVALGRNPNGAVQDIAASYRVLGDAPTALGGLMASVVVATGLLVLDAITGWSFTIALVVALVVWPAVARRIVTPDPEDVADEQISLEWAGLDRPLAPEQLAEIDHALGLDRGDPVEAPT